MDSQKEFSDEILLKAIMIKIKLLFENKNKEQLLQHLKLEKTTGLNKI